MRIHLVVAVAVAGTAAATCPNDKPPFTVENVVVFGDSYTDSGRLSAYIANNGSAPPPATDTSASNFTASGGYSWGHFATQQLGAKFYDYAGMPLFFDCLLSPLMRNECTRNISLLFPCSCNAGQIFEFILFKP